ncbi:MAG: hypothetical protein JWN95_3849 [Frankiales bacterium]|nr:hypothetical protein [Frankiales bacterium]
MALVSSRISPRPGPLRWLRYAFGGRLPERYREWILHDTTCSTWVLRHVSRTVLQLVPVIAAVLFLVPGPFWIRGMSAFGGVIMALIFSLGYMVETTEHRLVKADYPVGTGERVRDQHSSQGRAAATAARQAKMFARADRRDARARVR